MASRTKKPVKTLVKAKAPAKAKTSASSRTQGKSLVKPATKAATKSKPVTKAAAPRKVSNVKKPAASRETLANLRAHVDALEARLKRANSLTQSSVKAMQTAFTKLNERSAQAGAAQEKEIVEYVEALNVHLTGLIDKTREDVAHDLKIVLDDPRVETISEALTKANHRITRAEFDQAGALTSINEQIASLATVVDRRLRRETEERERNQNLLSSKIEAVEKSSAQAVSSIGEKIVTLTGELNKRTDHRISALKSEISDADQSYQKEIEDHKSEIGRRMEALEDDQRNSIPSIERRLVTIASRMESLETDRFNVERAPQIAAPAFEAAPTLAPDAFTPQHTEAYDTITPPAQNMQ
jgi:hypothetical protein